MELTKDIIRSLIKEEISRGLLLELKPQEEKVANSIANQLTYLEGEGMNVDAVLAQAQRQADEVKKNINDPGTTANRDDLDEMCASDKMQAIDMGVDHSHSDDHEGNMAKRQMFKTAQYAAEIFDNIQDNDEFPAWVQSKMTKIADYIGAVKHYLEYDHVMGEKLDKDATAGDYVKDFRKSDAPQFKGKSKKKKQEMAIAAYLDAQDDK